MLHGIIDIGSNTIRMAIYFIEGQQIEMLMKKKHIVGLASYLKDGVMQPAGIDAAVAVLQEFKAFLQKKIEEHGAIKITKMAGIFVCRKKSE